MACGSRWTDVQRNKEHDMTRRFELGRMELVGGGVAIIALAAIVASCGGGGGGDETAATAATLDSAGVTKAATEMAGFVNVCQAAVGGREAPTSAASPLPIGQLMTALSMQRHPGVSVMTEKAKAYGSTAPADTLGSCGGRYGYPTYSHSSGVTTAVLQFTDYCTTGSDGNKQVINGSLSFVNTATPTATGPITSKWEGTTAGLTSVTRNASGTVVNSQTMSFDKLGYTVGVPGGAPTSANPDKLTAAEFKVVDNQAGKTYRQTGYALVTFETATGGSQTTLTGRGYRSDGSYYDITTPTPLTMNASGAVTGGAMAFNGAAGNTAVATFVPGATLQVTMTVNGTPVTGLPTCAK